MPHENAHRPPSSSALHRVNVAIEHFSQAATTWAGSTWAFAIAVGAILLWAVSGPLFGFSNTWQLAINTTTTIVTFLMVFLIQRAQNKDALAIQIKLNELVASQQGASNRLINLEDCSEEELIELHQRFIALSERLQRATDDGQSHSVAEAAEALDDVQHALHQVHRAKKTNGRAKKER